jgi:hypothetical protein
MHYLAFGVAGSAAAATTVRMIGRVISVSATHDCETFNQNKT